MRLIGLLTVKEFQVKSRFILVLFLMSFVIKFSLGIYLLDTIPSSYGWSEIAKNVLDGKKTLLTYNFKTDNGKDTIRQEYYLVRPIMFVAFYVMIKVVFNSSIIVFVFLQALFSLVYCFFIYKLLLRHVSKLSAVLGLILALFYPYFISRIYNASEDNLYLLFLTSAIYLIDKFHNKKRWSDLIWSAVLMGLAYMTRSTILFYVFLLVPFLWVSVNWKTSFLFTIVFILSISPQLIYNYSIYRRILLSDHSGSRLWVANNNKIIGQYPRKSIDRIEEEMFLTLNGSDLDSMKNMTPLQKDDYFRSKAIKYIKENPLQEMRVITIKMLNSLNIFYNPLSNLKNNSSRIIGNFTFYVPLFIFGIIGLFYTLRTKRFINLLLLLCLISLILSSGLLWSHSRHTIPYHFIYIIWVCFYIDRHLKNRSIERKTL